MAKLEESWDDLAAVLRLTTGLLADFGFAAATLTAASVVIPIAYYLYRRGLGESYRTAGKFAKTDARFAGGLYGLSSNPVHGDQDSIHCYAN